MYIVIQRDRDAMQLVQLFSQRNGSLNRKIHRFEPDASLRVGLTDYANANRKRPRSAPLLRELLQRGIDASQSSRLCLVVDLRTMRGDDLPCFRHSPNQNFGSA